MADKFDRFTERARRVFVLAQEEAGLLDHHHLGTEHLLLGLMRERDGAGGRVLQEMRVDLKSVRTTVEFIVGRGATTRASATGLTPRAKRVIELAVDEARRMNHDAIGTSHLLLGIVREGEGIAAGALESLGVNLEQLRERVIGALDLAAEQRKAAADDELPEEAGERGPDSA
jgi:ATP-dependent Clp protease ATP-binding subunit ClpC